MSVFNLKPHKLYYEVSEHPVTLDNGDIVEGAKKWRGYIHCNAVPLTGKATEIKFEDGTTKVCSFVVYLDNDVRNFSLKENVRIHLLDGSIKIGRVKGFVRYQTYCKLWV